MGRFIGVFFIVIVAAILLHFILPPFIWRLTSDIDFASYNSSILIILVSIVIAQLSYIINILKNKKD